MSLSCPDFLPPYNMHLASCSADLSHVLQMGWGTKWRHFSLNAWLSLKPGALQQTALSGNGWGVFPLLWLSANFHFLALQGGNGVYPTMRWKRVVQPEQRVLKSIWGGFFFYYSSISNTVFCFLFFWKQACSQKCWSSEMLLLLFVPREETAFVLQTQWSRNLWAAWFMPFYWGGGIQIIGNLWM